MILTTLALLAVMLLATPAHAVLVSYSFDVRQSTGPFNEVEDTLFGYGPTVTDILHVTLLYNPDASDQPWPFPNRALYPLAHTAIIGSIGLNVFAGVRTDDFSCCPFGFPSGDVEVGDGPPPSTDIRFPAGADAWAGGMTITSGFVIAGLSGLAAPLVEAVRASDGSGFGVHLVDFDGTALSSTSLPVPFPTTGWDVGRFSIALIACIDDSDCYASAFRFSGDIDVNSLRSHVIGVPARVPSPSTLALLAGGLFLLTAIQVAWRRPK